MVTEEIVKKVRATQAVMADAFETCFLESEIVNLRVVIRLVIEFEAFIETFDYKSPYSNRVEYEIDSVFSGIQSFSSTIHAYGVLVGSVSSRINWNEISLPSFRDRFVTMFREFEAEASPENKCRILLDLYKLQIVFAGMLYD
jgi:hypothetical protein